MNAFFESNYFLKVKGTFISIGRVALFFFLHLHPDIPTSPR